MFSKNAIRDKSAKKDKGSKMFADAIKEMNEHRHLDPGVAELLESQFDAFIRELGEFFTEELKTLDEAIEKEESFSGVGKSKKSPKRQEQKESSSDSDNDLRDKKNISLKDLTLIILANMNSVTPIKPKRNEKIYALIHKKGHLNPKMLEV
jgi:hypothetical protein